MSQTDKERLGSNTVVCGCATVVDFFEELKLLFRDINHICWSQLWKLFKSTFLFSPKKSLELFLFRMDFLLVWLVSLLDLISCFLKSFDALMAVFDLFVVFEVAQEVTPGNILFKVGLHTVGRSLCQFIVLIKLNLS